MALTVGQVVGLEGFSVADIGEYGTDGKAFEHSYPTPDPFPSSRQDEADAELAEAQGLQAYREIGGEPYKRALIGRGFSEGEAASEVAKAEQDKTQTNTLGGLLNTPPAAGDLDEGVSGG
jgi:hypothetical protein